MIGLRKGAPLAAAAASAAGGRPSLPARLLVARHAAGGGPSLPAPPPSSGAKDELVARLLAAKEASGKSFSQIASETGLTNVYAAQLFYNQQQLHRDTAPKLRKAVPGLTGEDVREMMRAPMRSYDPAVLQEPAVYRLHEAITHGGSALKAVLNEEFGDGIMSAIDMLASVRRVEGAEGEARVVITFNGKFLPYREQRTADDTTLPQ